MLLSRDLWHRFSRRGHFCYAWNQGTVVAYRYFSAAAAGESTPSGNPSTGRAAAPAEVRHFLVRYLIESCGFSKRKSTEVSEHVLARVSSLENPETVVSFLKDQGFAKTHIRKVLSGEPSVLCASVGDTLEPKVRALKDVGFSKSDITQLFSTRPRAFGVSDLDVKVRFWASLFDSKETLLKAILSNRFIIFSSLDMKMKHNVSLLRDCLESKDRFTKMISKRHQLLTANTDKLKEAIRRVESLGIPRDSWLFDKVLCVFSENSTESFNAKYEILRSFGWSESEFISAIKRNPNFLGSSEKKIQAIMEFLLKDVGCEPSYVAMRPSILTLSLGGRIALRHHVLRRLTLNGLIGGGYDFYHVAIMTEKKFLKRYVFPHWDEVKALYQASLAACTTRNPSWFQMLDED